VRGQGSSLSLRGTRVIGDYGGGGRRAAITSAKIEGRFVAVSPPPLASPFLSLSKFTPVNNLRSDWTDETARRAKFCTRQVDRPANGTVIVLDDCSIRDRAINRRSLDRRVIQSRFPLARQRLGIDGFDPNASQRKCPAPSVSVRLNWYRRGRRGEEIIFRRPDAAGRFARALPRWSRSRNGGWGLGWEGGTFAADATDGEEAASGEFMGRPRDYSEEKCIALNEFMARPRLWWEGWLPRELSLRNSPARIADASLDLSLFR